MIQPNEPCEIMKYFLLGVLTGFAFAINLIYMLLYFI